MNGFERVLRFWESVFYTEPFYIVCELIALVVGLMYVRKSTMGLLFLGYIAFDFIIALADDYFKFFSSWSNHETRQFIFITNCSICVIELTVYYYFFFIILKSPIAKKIIKLILPAFFLVAFLNTIVFLTNFDSVYTNRANNITACEFLLIIPFCFIYYLELFDSPIINLFKRPSFLIVTGIFLYSVVSLPFYLVGDLLARNPDFKNVSFYRTVFHIIFYCPFGLNFLFLAKAFLCKEPLTK